MEPHPRIKLTVTSFDKSIETAGLMLIFILWILTLVAFYNLPHIIPVHFNAAGRPDANGDKTMLFILPILATIIFAGLSILIRHPHFLNYASPITVHNAEQQYITATKMLRMLNAGIALIFTLIVLFTYLTAAGITSGLGAWFLPLVIIICFGPMLYYSIKNKQENKK